MTEIAKSFFGPGAVTAAAPAHPLGDADERAIAAVVLRYATSIDTRDWALFRSCFTSVCAADYGAFGQWDNADDLTAAMARMHAGLGPTLHRITNIVITPAPDAAGERRAQARAYVDAMLTAAEPAAPPRQGIGLYEDLLAETPQGWKIAARRFIAVHIA